MKITYCGTSAVDIDGHDNVQPGDTVDVPDEQGHALLLAGTSIDTEGRQTPPEAPLWVADGGKAPKAPKITETAEAGKDAQ